MPRRPQLLAALGAALLSRATAALNCTAIGEALCSADGACAAFGVMGESIQLHGCADATVPNADWSTYARGAAGAYTLLPGVNIDEERCAAHARTGMNHACAPPPSPTPPPGPPLYEKAGAIEVGTYENTIVYWRGALLLLENIACSYKGHAGEWQPEVYGNHSYARLRDFATGAILANISSTVGFGFLSAFADYEADTLWLFGTPADRCLGNGQATTIYAWSTKDAALQNWSRALAFDFGKRTYNVQVTFVGPRGGAGAAERAAWAARRAARAPAALPPHRYAMFIEQFSWAVNNNADGDLTTGWAVVDSRAPPGGAGGGPSFTYNPLDDFYYILTGGHVVQLFRTPDFLTWTESSPAPFISPSAGDALVAPFNGFPTVAKTKGSPPQARVGVPEEAAFVPFDPVWEANWTSWSRNSNDGDFCCQHAAVPDAYVIWGASTQGRAPAPPLTGTDASTNSVGVARGVQLQALLAAYFPTNATA